MICERLNHIILSLRTLCSNYSAPKQIFSFAFPSLGHLQITRWTEYTKGSLYDFRFPGFGTHASMLANKKLFFKSHIAMCALEELLEVNEHLKQCLKVVPCRLKSIGN